MKLAKEHIQNLDPKINDKYSLNLYNFLKKYLNTCEHLNIFTDPEGSLFIGYITNDDLHWFSGLRLNSVLCGDFQTFAMSSKGFTKVENFWDEYTAIGRCAIDPEHIVPFIDGDNRFLTTGNARVCQWCGCEQVEIEEIVTRTVWKNLNKETVIAGTVRSPE